MKKELLLVCLVCCLMVFPSQSFADSSGVGIAGAQAVINGGDVQVNPGQVVSPSANANLSIDSHSKVSNRNFLQTGYPAAPAPMTYFGPWKKGLPYNVIQLAVGSVWKWAGMRKVSSSSAKALLEDIQHPFPPTAEIKVVSPEKGEGTFVGNIVVLVDSNQASFNARNIALKIAMKAGADQLEIYSNNYIQKPTSSGWHFGFGGGASGIIGEGSTGISGSGGTGFGSSSLQLASLPFIKARLWRSATAINLVASTSEDESYVPVKAKSSNEDWHIKNLSNFDN